MSAFTRYLLFQIPGWLLAAVLLLWLWPYSGLDGWLGALVYAAWVGKDFALYPLLRVGYEPDVPTGARVLIGAEGEAREDLNPTGYVRVAGELWRARVVEGRPPIRAGSAVRVEGAEGLTLFVSER